MCFSDSAVAGWMKVANPHNAHKMISVGSGKFGTWTISSTDKVYYMDNDNDAWVETPGSLKQISVGGNQVWGVNRHDAIYTTHVKSRHTEWTHISGALKQVSVSSLNHVWGVNAADMIFTRIGNEWRYIPGN